MDTREVARGLIRKSLSPIPIPRGLKAPTTRDWPQLALTEDEVSKFFTADSNIGINLGIDDGGSLVDVDLDSPEAVTAAKCFLPDTDLIHGRKSNPWSHYWYTADPLPKPVKFLDTNGECLLEVRSTGQQTIIPPSIHPSGEPMEWYRRGKPSEQHGEVIVTAAARTAACALLARHWPNKGSRQDFSLALSGTLLRAGWPVEMVEEFILTAAKAANDEEAEKRAGVVSDTAKRLATDRPIRGIPKLKEFLGEDVIKKITEWLGLNKTTPVKRNKQKSFDKKTQGQLLIELAAEVEFFHTPDRETFATFAVGDHRETSKIQGSAFKLWLQHKYFLKYKKPPSSQSLNEAISLFEAEALFNADTLSTSLRIGGDAGAIYIDLGTDAWDCIEITKNGIQVLKESPIRFRRARGMQCLPYPEPGTIDELRQFVNVADEQSWRLIVSWLVAALAPFGPYPILMLQGEQGSAKSTTARVLRELVDPSELLLRALPRDERDSMIATQNSHVLAFDNLSGLPIATSDILCRIATGGGYATRALFSDDQEILFNAIRPIMLNGIDDIASRQDLADRSLIITLPPIDDNERLEERKFFKNFYEARPRILGGLLKGVSAALANIDMVTLPSLPRMADFTKWATAAEAAFNWADSSVYEAILANRKEVVETGIDAHPVAEAIRSFLSKKESWRGTATELLEKLRVHIDDGSLQSRAWPKTPATLGTQLRRISAHLRRIGINIEYDREDQNRRRVIILNRVNSAVHAVQGVQDQQENQLNLKLEPQLPKNSIPQQKPCTLGAQPEAPNEKKVLDESVNSTLDNKDSVDSKLLDDSDEQPF